MASHRSRELNPNEDAPGSTKRTAAPQPPVEDAPGRTGERRPRRLRDTSYVLALKKKSPNLPTVDSKPAETLMNVVALIAKRFKWTSARRTFWNQIKMATSLWLRPSVSPKCIGTLRMGIHEGLAGLVAEQVRPVAVEQAQTHPRQIAEKQAKKSINRSSAFH